MDLSSTCPSPSGTPSPGTSVGQTKKTIVRFRRTNKAKSENFSDMRPILWNASSTSRITLCHRPRLNSKAEIDFVTHLAVCASQDWKKVDRIVVGKFCYGESSADEVEYEGDSNGLQWRL
jgi:phosphatidylserine decarboxylase